MALKTSNSTLTNDVLHRTQDGFDVAGSQFANITTNTTTVISAVAGFLGTVTINNSGFSTGGTITIYDNVAASGTKVATITVPISPPGTALLAAQTLVPTVFNVALTTGLTIVTAGFVPTADITVTYR